MPRLVAFGCSHVYGHGLPDCHIPPKGCGPNPSKFAWPQLLADKLGYECSNLSYPGSGNFQIFMNVLATDFRGDDLVIIAWSYFDRFPMYKIKHLDGEGRMVGFSGLEYKSMLAYQQEDIDFNRTNHWYNWLTVQHCELLLNNKNIKNFFYFSDIEPTFSSNKPKLIEVNNLLRDVYLVNRLDKALDNTHPGPECHKSQAELIYNNIKDRI